MIKCEKTELLMGAEKYGECISCGETDKSKIRKIEFFSGGAKKHSIRLCNKCFRELALIYIQNSGID